jgi:hypothetical protein
LLRLGWVLYFIFIKLSHFGQKRQGKTSASFLKKRSKKLLLLGACGQTRQAGIHVFGSNPHDAALKLPRSRPTPATVKSLLRPGVGVPPFLQKSDRFLSLNPCAYLPEISGESP